MRTATITEMSKNSGGWFEQISYMHDSVMVTVDGELKTEILSLDVFDELIRLRERKSVH